MILRNYKPVVPTCATLQSTAISQRLDPAALTTPQKGAECKPSMNVLLVKANAIQVFHVFHITIQHPQPFCFPSLAFFDGWISINCGNLGLGRGPIGGVLCTLGIVL